MKQLGSQDAAFLYLESAGAHLTLTGLYVYQQPRRPHSALSFEDILRHVRSRLPALPLLRQKLLRPPLDLDYPYWIEDRDFDLESHVLRYRGRSPRNRQELYAIVAELHSRPLDLSRPPWEMQVIEQAGPLEGLPKNCFALVTRYHHAAVDGASGSALVRGLHGTRPGDIDPAGAAGIRPRTARPPGTLGLLARAAIHNLGGQYRLLRSVGGALPGVLGDWRRDRAAAPAAVPDTLFNRPVGADRVFHATSFPLAGLKAVRDAVPGATVNDVILAVCAGGLRGWLQERDQLPEESLVAMVPVNLRDEGRPSDGNDLGMMFLPIFTDVAAPLARVRAVQERTRQAKARIGSDSQGRLREVTRHLPALTLSATGRLATGLGLGGRLWRPCNCTITNVPGPDRNLYLGRARMVYTSGAGPLLDGMGLIVSLFTYAGRVDFGITSCPDMVADPAGMARHFEVAFEALKAAAQAAAGS